MKKRTVSMLLAGAMTMSMISTAAAADDNKTIQAVGENGKTAGSSDVKLTGEVKDAAVLLSVVVPTVINFTVATSSAEQGTTVAAKGENDAVNTTAGEYHVFTDLLSGEGTVTNNSNVPVKLEITDISDDKKLTTLMDLAMQSDELSELTALKTPFDTVNGDYATNPILLASSIPVNGGTTTLKVVGKAGVGTKKGESGKTYGVNLPSATYTVTATLKVSDASVVAGE